MFDYPEAINSGFIFFLFTTVEIIIFPSLNSEQLVAQTSC